MKSHSQILFSFDLSRHYHMHEYVAAYQYIYGGANGGGTFCVVLFLGFQARMRPSVHMSVGLSCCKLELSYVGHLY